MYCTGPVLYEFGDNKVVRLSKDLVIKGGDRMTRGEAETQILAASLGFRVPTVHRVFRHTVPNIKGKSQDCWLMVMDSFQEWFWRSYGLPYVRTPNRI